MPDETNRTHVEDLKDPIEVLFPNSNRIFVILRVESSRGRMSFTLLDDLPLDPGQSPAIENLVIGLLSVHATTVSTHVVNSSIAPSTDRLSSSNRLPSRPRSRALHTLAQDSPRST